MRIKVKSSKGLNDLAKKRLEKINQAVLNFLKVDGYILDKNSKDPYNDLLEKLHKNNLTVVTKITDEKINKNQYNKNTILTFDLVVYYKEYRKETKDEILCE